MTTKLIPLSILMVSATISQGTIIIQELYDGSAADATINGAGGTATSIGMTGNWATNGSTGIFTANNFDVDGSTLPGLPSNGGAQGGVYRAGANNWGANIYATRALSTTISFNFDQEIFFSVRLRNGGDSAMGVGLASGANGSAEFVGAGFTWDNATTIGGGSANNAAYVSHGTLDTNSGVYGIRANEAAGSVNGYGLLVGRITISSTGNDTIDIIRYAENATITASPSYTVTSSFDSSMAASHLLLWMNGSGQGELDAIRFGNTFADVTAVPEPSAAALLGLGGIALFLRRRK